MLRNIPLQRKLILIILAVSGVTVLLACTAFVIYEQGAIKQYMVDDLSSAAAVIAENSVSALTFDDPTSAAVTLKSLASHPEIIGAALYDKEGRLFARYQRADSTRAFVPPPVRPAGYRFTSEALELFRRVDSAGEVAGTVYIE